MLGLSSNLYMNLKVHHLTAAHHAADRVEEEGCVPAMPHAHKLVDIRGSEAHLQTRARNEPLRRFYNHRECLPNRVFALAVIFHVYLPCLGACLA